MSNNKKSSVEQSQWYICPITKVQCDDECCVSADDCHIKSWSEINSSNNKESIVEMMKLIKIKHFKDLPEYGRYVLVNGVDEQQYGIRNWHVCEMNDLEDGMQFKENGTFYWITESGRKIENVTHWCELPKLI